MSRWLKQSFSSDWISQPRRVAGVMTGTSLDGIDVCVVENPAHLTSSTELPKLLRSDSFEFSPALREQLKSALTQPLTLEQYSLLRHLYSVEVADALNNVLKKSPPIDAIAVHGQTLFHAPGREHSRTLQMLDASVLAEKTGCLIIHDFRSADVALGGQGAPLVPAADRLLFANDGVAVDIVNIGGIANITSIREDGSFVAYDTGPGNCIIDEWMQSAFDVALDYNGEEALKGKVQEELLQRLLAHPYFAQAAPKSTGREVFNKQWLETVLAEFNTPVSKHDVLRTLTALTAHTIAKAISPVATNVYVAGGGALNRAIMQSLARQCTQPVQTTEALGVPVLSREAMCFAVLGWLRCAGEVNVLRSVTGARADSCSGSLTFPAAAE